MREKEADALIGSAIKTVEQIEALLIMIGASNGAEKRNTAVAASLREIASLLDSLPLLQSDLLIIKKRLRLMLSSDPDKTPPAMDLRDLRSDPNNSETKFSPVEQIPRMYSRTQTRPGIGDKKK